MYQVINNQTNNGFSVNREMYQVVVETIVCAHIMIGQAGTIEAAEGIAANALVDCAKAIRAKAIRKNSPLKIMRVGIVKNGVVVSEVGNLGHSIVGQKIDFNKEIHV